MKLALFTPLTLQFLCLPALSQCELQKITADDPESVSEFGSWVVISGDTAVIGAPHEGSSTKPGAAYVYERAGAAWTQTAKLVASDADGGDSFGTSFDIDGDTILIGSPGDDDQGTDSGSAYVFERSGSSWTQAVKLLPMDGAANDIFGAVVSLDGGLAVISANLDDDKGTDSGSAYVFQRTVDGTWSQTSKLLPDDGSAGAHFSASLALGDGMLLAGAPRDGSGPLFASGSVYVFEPSPESWTKTDKLTASDVSGLDLFGSHVDLEGDTAVVGAYRDDDLGINSGSAYVFQRSPLGDWAELAKLHASDGGEEDWFGGRVAISGLTVLICAQHQDSVGTDAGAAYMFEPPATP